jgi:hypothetical protein
MICALFIALAEAKDAYGVWSSIQITREKALIEKCNKKPAPYKHVKVMTIQLTIQLFFLVLHVLHLLVLFC